MFTRKRPEDMEFERRVGKLVRTVRINAGLNQTQLAQIIGTSQSAISEIETAANGCTVWLLHRIARGLGFEMKIVFERKNYETS